MREKRQKAGEADRQSGGQLGRLSLLLLPLAAVIVALAVWGPEELARYRDRGILNNIQMQETEEGTEGYRYSLSGKEKVYILSKCLNNQILPESELNAMTRTDLDYQELTGTYAFVVNHNGPSGKEITNEEIYETANEGIAVLKENGILVRWFGKERIRDFCRITIGSREQMEALVEQIDQL